MNRKAIGWLAFLTSLAMAPLDIQALEIRPLIKAGVDFGGETIVTAEFTNGDTQEINANEGFYLGAGAAILDDARNLEYHLTIAYKFAVIEGGNGDIDWTRVPLEALVFYRFRSVRVGGGLTYHLSPQLEGSGVVGGLDVDFKDALGAVLQVDWRISTTIALGGRYTLLEYEAKGASSGSTKSNGVGITFSMGF